MNRNPLDKPADPHTEANDWVAMAEGQQPGKTPEESLQEAADKFAVSEDAKGPSAEDVSKIEAVKKRLATGNEAGESETPVDLEALRAQSRELSAQYNESRRKIMDEYAKSAATAAEGVLHAITELRRKDASESDADVSSFFTRWSQRQSGRSYRDHEDRMRDLAIFLTTDPNNTSILDKVDADVTSALMEVDQTIKSERSKMNELDDQRRPIDEKISEEVMRLKKIG